MSGFVLRGARIALVAVLSLSACGEDAVSAGPVATSFVVVSGSPQSITAGATSAPLVVRVLDQSFRPVVGTTVTWAISSTVTGSLVATTTTTNVTGESSVAVNAGLTPGVLTISATVSGLTPLGFVVTIIAPPPPPPQDVRGTQG